MPPRAPGVHTHEEWKGMAQPVGLVVEPVVLNRLGVFPESATTVLADWQQRLEQLLEDQPVGEQWLSVAPSFELFCQEVLAWQPGDLRKPEELAAPVAVHLDDYDEVLRPNWIVPEPTSQGDGPLKAQLLVQELPVGTLFDALPKGTDGRRSWEATPQQRLERLLKESEHPIGLLWNGVALRLVYAPRGESSGHLTFPLEPMTTVDGRPMLAALQMLLGPDRLFEGGASNTRLRPLMEQSRKEQNEVSTRLAEQVLEALWILLRGFDAAGLEVEDPSHIYGGLITVLLRLVFLLYAEDEELMPTDSLYGQHYSVGGLAQRLRQDRADYQNAMEGRRGAWATLLSLFRLVYDGGGSTDAYLPARHGDLFDPETYPFLEGRTADTSYTDGPLTAVPAISDDVVEQVLTKLLLLDGQILSYRALDVEQIGSVYEGIMGFMVEKATGPSVGITHKPPRQKITITVVVDASELLAQPASKRDKWLKDTTGVDLKLGDRVNKGVKAASTVEDLCDVLDKRLSKHTPRGGFQATSLVLQPTAERRRSGSHYTPRTLTEPIVAETFRPWLESCHHQPTAEQVLSLKVCDPAMGSGAFLVAVCRFLASWLVQAWERDGFPKDFRQEWDKDLYARRLIAQRCLYGVDKNPFAVNLAKLSLWLITLSKDLPFTFVDHAMKCGDSLVGYSVKEIRAAMHEVQLGFLDDQNRLYEQMGIDRRESFSFDSLNDEDYDNKKQLLKQQIKAIEGLRQAGDLMVAALFAKEKSKDRADKQQVYLAMLSGAFQDDALNRSIQDIRRGLAAGEKGITPFHWDMEFPEVFREKQAGFDAFVGNPPFLGGKKISTAFGTNYKDWLQEKTSDGNANADLVAYFLRLAYSFLNDDGAATLITTNSARQGDTRRAGLEWIDVQGGCLFSAKRRFKWPGVAAVVVSIISMAKRETAVQRYIDSRPVKTITPYLLDKGGSRSPEKLSCNRGISNIGCYINGMGFTFEDSDESSLDTPGTPTPMSELKRLASINPRVADAVFPYIGGDEINGDPSRLCNRSVINFRDLGQHECESQWPELMSIVRTKVKPHRDTLNRDVYRVKWWQFAEKQLSLQQLQAQKSHVIAIPRVAMYYAPALLPAAYVYSEGVAIFPVDQASELAPLFSQVHECWFTFFASTFGSADVPRYSPSEVFETFPLPPPASGLEGPTAELLEARRKALHASHGGLTDLYSSFHSPAEKNLFIHELREGHCALDAKVLLAYGWSDVPTECGFALDELEINDEVRVPDDVQQHIDSGALFFWDATDALNFQDQLRACCAVKPKKKLPWRYRWPDDVRDEVLARLLALNAERYEEEVNMGLHSKGAKQAAKTTSKRKTKSGSSAGLKLTSEPYQTGLKLF